MQVFFTSTCKFGDFGAGHSLDDELNNLESNWIVLIAANYIRLRNQTRFKGKNNGQTSENCGIRNTPSRRELLHATETGDQGLIHYARKF